MESMRRRRDEIESRPTDVHHRAVAHAEGWAETSRPSPRQGRMPPLRSSERFALAQGDNAADSSRSRRRVTIQGDDTDDDPSGRGRHQSESLRPARRPMPLVGVERSASGDSELQGVTNGTPPYPSREQARALPHSMSRPTKASSEQINAKTSVDDIGRLPVRGNSAPVMQRRRSGGTDSPPAGTASSNRAARAVHRSPLVLSSVPAADMARGPSQGTFPSSKSSPLPSMSRQDDEMFLAVPGASHATANGTLSPVAAFPEGATPDLAHLQSELSFFSDSPNGRANTSGYGTDGDSAAEPFEMPSGRHRVGSAPQFRAHRGAFTAPLAGTSDSAADVASVMYGVNNVADRVDLMNRRIDNLEKVMSELLQRVGTVCNSIDTLRRSANEIRGAADTCREASNSMQAKMDKMCLRVETLEKTVQRDSASIFIKALRFFFAVFLFMRNIVRIPWDGIVYLHRRMKGTSSVKVGKEAKDAQASQPVSSHRSPGEAMFYRDDREFAGEAGERTSGAGGNGAVPGHLRPPNANGRGSSLGEKRPPHGSSDVEYADNRRSDDDTGSVLSGNSGSELRSESSYDTSRSVATGGTTAGGPSKSGSSSVRAASVVALLRRRLDRSDSPSGS